MTGGGAVLVRNERAAAAVPPLLLCVFRVNIMQIDIRGEMQRRRFGRASVCIYVCVCGCNEHATVRSGKTQHRLHSSLAVARAHIRSPIHIYAPMRVYTMTLPCSPARVVVVVGVCVFAVCMLACVCALAITTTTSTTNTQARRTGNLYSNSV